jgi:hypothetical protein
MNNNERSATFILIWLGWLLAVLIYLGAILFLSASETHAQSNTCVQGDALTVNTTGSKNNQCIALNQQPAGTGTTMIIANDSGIGTTLNKFAKLTGAPSTAVISSNGDTDGAIGVVTSGAGTTGSAVITILGQVSCIFDGATVAGDYVIIAATGGGCHDAGAAYPTAGTAYGRVLSTNGGGGTYVMELMTPDTTGSAGTSSNGKTKAASPAGSYQYNGTGNNFTGGELSRISANAVRQINGSTAQKVSSCVDCGSEIIETVMTGNAGSGYSEVGMERGSTSTATARLIARNGMTSTPSTTYVQVSSGGAFLPGANMDLGQPTGVSFQTVYLTTDVRSDSGVRFSRNSSTSPYLYNEGLNLKLRNWNDNAYQSLLQFGRAFTSAQFDKTNTTLADITGLTTTSSLSAGKTYSFEANLFVDADVTGGSKYAIAGTATATAIKYYVNMTCDATNLNVITSRQTALAGSVGQAGCTAGLVKINGTITVNAAGTLTVQFAQNAANGTSSVLTMSNLQVELLN